jgi:lactate permease
MVAFLKVWRPPIIKTIDHGSPTPGTGPSMPTLSADGAGATVSATIAKRHTASTVLVGWSPFIIASVLIFGTGLPAIARYLNVPALSMPMPVLHRAVLKMPPVAPTPTPEDAIVNLNFIAIPGTVVFFAGLAAASLARLPLARTLHLFRSTLVQTLPSTLAIIFMVGLAYVTRYSGMDTVLGLSLTGTGVLFPFFGTLLGWLGVALTGTDAGSNALFGNLQAVTANQLGLSPILMGAANSTGGVMGKMIDAQSIVVASTATHQQGQEAAIFKAVFVHSIVLACLVGLIVMAYAYVFPSLIP